ncbi:MAG TPA: hypothetical protein VK886_09920 [Vicinamibacterales bacterium]|nr:hypothetical protein [Vicinamibacterales bacterium]
MTAHPDTADLYGLALEQAGFAVLSCNEPQQALAPRDLHAPLAIVVHFRPKDDPLQIGGSLRRAWPQAVLLGLFSMQLPVTALKNVLETFDDVVMIPCSPDALISRLARLEVGRRNQNSA